MKNLFQLGLTMTLLVCIGLNSRITGQNLVLNPGFEEYDPTEQTGLPSFDYIHGNYLPYDWTDYASCDFHIESPNEPPNRARTGDCFARFAAISDNGTSTYREYPIGKTEVDLDAGSLYEVEFWIKNSAGNATAASNAGLVKIDIGAYISTNLIPCDFPSDCIFGITPEFESVFPASSTDWQRINGYYIPETTGIHYISIGHFFNQGNSIGFDGSLSMLVFLDDVSIIECTDTSLAPIPSLQMQDEYCISNQFIGDLTASQNVQDYRYTICDENGVAYTEYSPWTSSLPDQIDFSEEFAPYLEKGNCYQGLSSN